MIYKTITQKMIVRFTLQKPWNSERCRFNLNLILIIYIDVRGDVVTTSNWHRCDNATTYHDDIVTISSQMNIVSASFRYCYYGDGFFKKFNFFLQYRFTSSRQRHNYHDDIVTISSFDVATMVMIFLKNSILAISILISWR